MQTFDVGRLALLIELLTIDMSYCYDMASRGKHRVPSAKYSRITAEIRRAKRLCDKTHLFNAFVRIDGSMAFWANYEPRMNAAALGAEVRHTIQAILADVDRITFLRVREAHFLYIDNPCLFGQTVADAFPSATSDIREAGNCLAADCNTAAVFHMMRAVEWGLRALCVHLGFRRLRTQNKKTKKVTYRLLEYTEWEIILNQLQERVDKKLARVRRGPQKQLYQEFYFPVLQDIRGIRDAWRNHVMHTRREYADKDAEAILGHVKRLLVALASRVSEV